MEDVKQAYIETNGSIGEMMNHVPHSTHDDEARFIVLVSKLIKEGTLPSLPEWESSTKDGGLSGEKPPERSRCSRCSSRRGSQAWK